MLPVTFQGAVRVSSRYFTQPVATVATQPDNVTGTGPSLFGGVVFAAQATPISWAMCGFCYLNGGRDYTIANRNQKLVRRDRRASCTSSHKCCAGRVPLFTASTASGRLELWRRPIPRVDKILNHASQAQKTLGQSREAHRTSAFYELVLSIEHSDFLSQQN